MTPIKRTPLFAVDAEYLPHHVFVKSTELRTISTKGKRAEIFACHMGREAAKNGGMTPCAVPPKKNNHAFQRGTHPFIAHRSLTTSSHSPKIRSSMSAPVKLYTISAITSFLFCFHS